MNTTETSPTRPTTECTDVDVGSVRADPGGWLTRIEAAEYLRISVDTLDRWRQSGRVRSHRPPGLRSIRFRRADLDAALVPDDGSAEDDGPASGPYGQPPEETP